MRFDFMGNSSLSASLGAKDEDVPYKSGKYTPNLMLSLRGKNLPLVVCSRSKIGSQVPDFHSRLRPPVPETIQNSY